MENIVKVFGLIMIVAGAAFFIKPHTMRKLAYYFIGDKRMKISSIMTIVLGVIFLIVASRCKFSWVVVIFGIWAIIKGVLLFIIGKNKLKMFVDQFLIRPSRTLRVYAVIEIMLGIALIYAA